MYDTWYTYVLSDIQWVSDIGKQLVHGKICCLKTMVLIQTLTRRFLLLKKAVLQLKGAAYNQNPLYTNKTLVILCSK